MAEHLDNQDGGHIAMENVSIAIVKTYFTKVTKMIPNVGFSEKFCHYPVLFFLKTDFRTLNVTTIGTSRKCLHWWFVSLYSLLRVHWTMVLH